MDEERALFIEGREEREWGEGEKEREGERDREGEREKEVEKNP